jgi:predicted GIY-YIG superfamily endonuclease
MACFCSYRTDLFTSILTDIKFINYWTDPVTDNLERRFQEHMSGNGSKATRESKPLRIIHKESFPDQSTALDRERQLKR